MLFDHYTFYRGYRGNTRHWRSIIVYLACVAMLLTTTSAHQRQTPDSTFEAKVKSVTYPRKGPAVLFDEAHFNLHSAAGGYRPFVQLLERDGYVVKTTKRRFTRKGLIGYRVVVIADPRGAGENVDLAMRAAPAFTEDECEVIANWVSSGGSLLLLTDHYPIGSAAANLGRRFGVDMSNGYTEDPVNKDPKSRSSSQLVFSRDNDLLNEHPITRGRVESERVNRVITFTGQSLSVPSNASPILVLSPAAVDRIPKVEKGQTQSDSDSRGLQFQEPVAAGGRAQMVALSFGKGRVVITGEAAMFTAQISANAVKIGMNVPGIDNQQLALNVMHWLTRKL